MLDHLESLALVERNIPDAACGQVAGKPGDTDPREPIREQRRTVPSPLVRGIYPKQR